MNQNRFNVPGNLWHRMNQDERQSFENAFERTQRRRQEIIQSLSPDCRSEVDGHFVEIAATVCGYFIKELQIS